MHPNLPEAVRGDAILWDDVGPGWYLVLYDSSRAYEIRRGPKVLFVVDPAGVLYEVASWTPTDDPGMLVDATGTTALLVGFGSTMDNRAWRVVDLATGAATPVHEARSSELSPLGVDRSRAVSLSRPDGTELIVYGSDGTTERLERRGFDGTVISLLFEQRLTGIDSSSLSWLQSPDGAMFVVGHAGGLALLRNDGSRIRNLDAPNGHRCRPVRWWDADTLVTTCYGNEANAPLDEVGDPNFYYGRLWLIPTDGSAGRPLTSLPGEPISTSDFGYSDAFRIDATILLEWRGDCGAANIRVLEPDGTGTILGPFETPSISVEGHRIVGVDGTEVTVYGWEGCDAYVGALFVIDADGAFITELVPRVGDGRGVDSVTTLGNTGLTQP